MKGLLGGSSTTSETGHKHGCTGPTGHRKVILIYSLALGRSFLSISCATILLCTFPVAVLGMLSVKKILIRGQSNDALSVEAVILPSLAP